MEKSIFRILQNNQKISGYTVQEKTHQEKKHLVVPVTMIVEGVLSGSAGPLLHLATDFGKFPESWNGIPVVINHPAVNGKNVSANSPELIDAGTVGRIYNAYMDDTSLKAEAWLDEAKLTTVSPDTASAVTLKQAIEVSVGVYTESDNTPGEYNGQTYTAIARNHRPDHLALLPGGVGACSISDGCGIRVNNKKGEDNEMNVAEITQVNQYRDLRYTVKGIVDNSAEGLREKLDTIRSLVNTLDVPGDPNTGDGYVSNYLEEAYDTYLVYEQYRRGENEKYYKQGYQIDAAGDATFVGEPIEVEKKTEYISKVSTNQFIRTKTSKKSMEGTEKCTPCVKAKVDSLIGNAASKFTEDDRAVLETLSETVLDRMMPEPPAAPVVNELSPEDKAALAFGKAQLKEKRDGLVANIKANTAEGLWTDEVLVTMSDEMLEKVSKSIVPKEEESDFSMNAGGGSLNANADGKGKPAPMLPAGFAIKQ